MQRMKESDTLSSMHVVRGISRQSRQSYQTCATPHFIFDG